MYVEWISFAISKVKCKQSLCVCVFFLPQISKAISPQPLVSRSILMLKEGKKYNFLLVYITLDSHRKIWLVFSILHSNAMHLLGKCGAKKSDTYPGMLLSYMNNLRWILMQLQANTGKFTWAQKRENKSENKKPEPESKPELQTVRK